jgi:predicted transcriptional regulator
LRSSTFSPRRVDPERLHDLFVRARWPLVEHLVESFGSAAACAEARYGLLVGPRGAGKSHVLALVLHGLREVGDRIVVATLDEEVHVASLAAFLDRILAAMPFDPDLPDIATQRASLRIGGDVSARAAAIIDARLRGRGLVLVVENLDGVLDAIRREGRQELRAILQNRGSWSILASAVRETAAFRHRDEPFFQMFTPTRLQPFDALECREALRRLAVVHEQHDLADYLDSPTGLARVRAIRHLTGGSPRAMAMIFPHLTRGSLDDLVAAFEQLAEALTVSFQDAMARLSTHQRPIVETLAENWRPMTVKELASRTLQPETSVSTLLRRLAKDGVVSRRPVGRESFYVVAEPLHRIARAMQREDQGMAVLARFLRHWYLADELDVLTGDSEVFATLAPLMQKATHDTAFEHSCAAVVGANLRPGTLGVAAEASMTWMAESGSSDAEVARTLAAAVQDDASDVALTWQQSPTETATALCHGAGYGRVRHQPTEILDALRGPCRPPWAFDNALFRVAASLGTTRFADEVQRLADTIEAHAGASVLLGEVPEPRGFAALVVALDVIANLTPSGPALDVLRERLSPAAVDLAVTVVEAQEQPARLAALAPEESALSAALQGALELLSITPEQAARR